MKLLTKEQFEANGRFRFGRSNPEQFHVEWWKWAIQEEMGWIDDKNFHPWHLRKQFDVPNPFSTGEQQRPIWTFKRMGRTTCELGDGRKILIGGEFDDYYDPDFCIYNDVVVIHPDKSIEIYGYPPEVFPPTDFHSATIVDGRIIIIGRIGYSENRDFDNTPVYALDLETYKIQSMSTHGQKPGWIHTHTTTLKSGGLLILEGGFRQVGEELFDVVRNYDTYALDLETLEWTLHSKSNYVIYRISCPENPFWQMKEMFEYDRIMKLPEDERKKKLRPPIKKVAEEINAEIIKDISPSEAILKTVNITFKVFEDRGNIDCVFENSIQQKEMEHLAEKVRKFLETEYEAKMLVTRIEL